MDFTGQIDFDGFSVNTATRSAGGRPLAGYLVDDLDVSSVDVAGYFEKRALHDGSDASDVYLGARRIGMVVSTFGTSRGDFWDRHQNLLAAFSPTLSYAADSANLGFRPLNFYQPTDDLVSWPLLTYPNGIPLRYYVRPAAYPSFNIRRDELGGADAKGLSLPVRLVLIARDPRKYLQDETELSIASGTTTTPAPTTTYLGDYPSDLGTATIISAGSTGSVVYRIEGSSFSVSIDAASSTYVLDFKQRTIKKNGVVNMGLLLDNDDWPVFGLNATVNLHRDAATCATSITVAFRQAFA